MPAADPSHSISELPMLGNTASDIIEHEWKSNEREANKLENPGEGYLTEKVNLLCALNRGKTPGGNVFTLDMSVALTAGLANVTLFDTACEKEFFV